MIHVKPPSDLNPEEALLQREELQRLDRMIDDLIPRHAYAIRAHYGINCEPQTYRNIGTKMGVCGQRVRQMVQHGERILRFRLKQALEQDDPYEYRKKLLSRAEDAKRHAKLEAQRRADLEAEWEARSKQREEERQRQEQLDKQRAEQRGKAARMIAQTWTQHHLRTPRSTGGFFVFGFHL